MLHVKIRALDNLSNVSQTLLMKIINFLSFALPIDFPMMKPSYNNFQYQIFLEWVAKDIYAWRQRIVLHCDLLTAVKWEGDVGRSKQCAVWTGKC
jgi:hypothetical protein